MELTYLKFQFGTITASSLKQREQNCRDRQNSWPSKELAYPMAGQCRDTWPEYFPQNAALHNLAANKAPSEWRL